jgi:hypothetical protein
VLHEPASSVQRNIARAIQIETAVLIKVQNCLIIDA